MRLIHICHLIHPCSFWMQSMLLSNCWSPLQMLIWVHYYCFIHWEIAQIFNAGILRLYSVFFKLSQIIFTWCNAIKMRHILHIKFLSLQSWNMDTIMLGKLFFLLKYIFIICHWKIILIYHSSFGFGSHCFVHLQTSYIITTFRKIDLILISTFSFR